MIDPRRYPLIPWPRRIEALAGEVAFDSGPVVVRDPAHPHIAPEGFTLDAGGGRVRITARDAAGEVYGREALRQLTTPGGSVPAVRIEDAPRFGWRGLHLDVSRHFFSVDFIKRYVDLMATYRLNRFHWHLTDDQGWRIEIKKYPRLTEVGAWRRETIVGHARRGPKGYDGTPHGGFYTQAQIREVVAYARERAVEVVPEIEMPGHSVAALTAYPEYACGEPPGEVRTTWGISEVVFCPREPTFAFFADVLAEVAELFPFGYVHVGGDEAPKTRWRACADAQAVIRREGLADEDELQSYFIRRASQILHGLGKRLIGWDEILEGGLAPDATVMSWRGTSGGIAAARAGHDVVMCPQQRLYFDHYQADPATQPLAIGGLSTLADVYAHEPVPDELSGSERDLVLGPQGCVWTEYMATTDDVERMAYPRVLALAEIAWTDPASKDARSFGERLRAELRHLDRLGVRYGPAAL